STSSAASASAGAGTTELMLSGYRRLVTGLLLLVLLAQGLLVDGRVTGGAELGVVRASFLLPLGLAALDDQCPQMCGLIAEGINEVLCVRAKACDQAVDVGRDRLRTLGRQTPIDEVPGQVLLDEAQPEHVEQPLQHLASSSIRNLLDRTRERLP